MEKSIERIPTWSLGYIINGDAAGLNDDEIKMIDNLFHKQHIKWFVRLKIAKKPERKRIFLHSHSSDFLLKSRIVW